MNTEWTAVILCLLLISCKKDVVKTFYKDGVTESECSIEAGIRNGLCKFYFPTGELEHTEFYMHGDREGQSNFYSREGNVIQTSNWKNGRLDGLAIQYYQNGKAFVQSNYSNGLKVGEEIVFDSSGLITDVQTYDSVGRLVYIYQPARNNTIAYSKVVPIVSLSEDSVVVGDHCDVRVSFGYHLKGKIGFDFEGLNTIDQPLIEAEADEANRRYLFKIKFKSSGAYSFMMTIRHELEDAADTLSVDGVSRKLDIFVLEGSNL